jgi:hypothetical protein
MDGGREGKGEVGGGDGSGGEGGGDGGMSATVGIVRNALNEKPTAVYNASLLP